MPLTAPSPAVAALVAACHSRICRPPTSGGTGGSLPRGAVSVGGRASAPRGTRAAKVAKEESSSAGKSTFRRTAFTKKIEDAIKAEPALVRAMSMREIAKKSAEDYKVDLESARKRDIQTHLKKGFKIRTEGTVSRVATQAKIAKELGIPDVDSMSAMGVSLALDKWHRDTLTKFIDDPSLTPANKYEESYSRTAKMFTTDYQSEAESIRKMGRPSSQTLELIDGNHLLDGTNKYDRVIIDLSARIAAAPRGDKNRSGFSEGIDSEFEAASTRVGKIVLDEMRVRKQKIADEMRASLTERHSAMMSVVNKAFNVGEGDVIDMWGTYTGGKRTRVGFHIYRANGTRDTVYADKENNAEVFDAIEGSRLNSLELPYILSGVELSAHQQAFKNVLEEIRPVGGFFNDTPAHKKTEGGMSTNEQVARIARFYPSDWIDASNTYGKMTFKTIKGRQHYDYDEKIVTLDKEDLSTGLHEVGHRMEDSVPGLVALEGIFYDRRVGSESLQPLSRLSPDRKYKADEEACADQFFAPYCGKSYGGSAYEIFTMGIEAVAMDDHNGHPQTIDDDYASFILGALTTLYRDTE
jgi:hypothetical protein